MPIHPASVKPGIKFIDDTLLTVQPQHRLHRIVEMTRGGFKAVHVATGNTREFTTSQINDLRQVPGGVDAMANMDWLVGEKIAITIRGSGTTISGIVTAIDYLEVAYKDAGGVGKKLKMLGTIELDKNGATRYEAAAIEGIQLL